MFHGAIEKIIVACFYGPRYIEGNTVFMGPSFLEGGHIMCWSCPSVCLSRAST